MTETDPATPAVPADLAPALVAGHGALRAADQEAAIAIQRFKARQAAHLLECQEAVAAAGLHLADGWRVEVVEGAPRFTKDAPKAR